jgi:peptidoglycan/xylan/chitin deacetylase (PgdA/CDA1 family)
VILKSAAQYLSPGGPGGRLSVLIFHRVLPRPDPMAPGATDAARFDSVLRWVRSWFNVIPLDMAVQSLLDGTLPSRALAITFDDGYADNHDVAMPLLLRHGLSATFFIATGFLDGGRMWNDTIAAAVHRTAPEPLDLTPLGQPGLGRFNLDGPAQRGSSLSAIIDAVKYLPTTQRADVANAIGRIAAIEPDAGLMMTSGQVRDLRRAGMLIGAHTVNHPILARLARCDARSEIQGSKQRLEDILDERVSLFAYPNGKPGSDYTPESVEIVRDLGFDAAVTTAWGASRLTTDPFQIPRFTPWDRQRWRYGARLVHNLV